MNVRVGILGATGAVGQRLVQLLSDHDTFDIAAVAASEASAGRRYERAVNWQVSTTIPAAVATREVIPARPEAFPEDIALVFSALPSGVAETVEPAFLKAGYSISSNASNARLAEDIPLVIPEVNRDHIGLLDRQRDERGWDGVMVKNPNCSTITAVPPLAALTDYGLQRLHVATLQAVSGAGYGGVTSTEILDNVLPYIDGEGEKIETESRKLLGSFNGAAVTDHEVTVSASTNRVATQDGHLENIWVETAKPLTPAAAETAFEEIESAALPSAPNEVIRVFEDPMRPQPRLDRNVADGHGIAVGPVSETPWGIQFDSLAHNTIRGAAGASLLNGELLLEDGYL